MAPHEPPKTANKVAKISQQLSHLILIVFNNDVLVCVKDMLATITVLIRMQLSNIPLNMNKRPFDNDEQMKHNDINRREKGSCRHTP